MPNSVSWRERLESLPAQVQPLLVLAGVTDPVIATVTYAYGLVMRVLQIGAEVRDTVAQARLDLDAEVRSAGLFRVPLEVDVQTIQLRLFVGPGRRQFPNALAQLEDDVRAFQDPRHPDRRRARERLSVASGVIPLVYDHLERTGELRHRDFPLLSTAYLQLLDPGELAIYRSLVTHLHIERTTLLEGDTVSLNLLEARLPRYIEAQLRVEGVALEAAQQRELVHAKESVRDIYRSFVLGDDYRRGGVADAVSFIVARALERIRAESDELAAELQRLASLPAGERDDDRRAEIGRRQEALREIEQRLRRSTT